MSKLIFSLLIIPFILGCNPKENSSISNKSMLSEVTINLATSSIKGEGEGWNKRHQTILDRLNMDSELILVGNSIFHSLDNTDRKEVWAKHLDKYKTINMGISGDRTENVIWRLNNGLLDNINPKVAILLIGTNNTDGNHYLNISTPEELSNAIWKICEILNKKLPNTKILLMGILPYGYKPNHRDNINKATNAIISEFSDKNSNIHYVDISAEYYSAQGKVKRELMPDFLHPNANGHKIMFDSLEDKISKLMKE